MTAPGGFIENPKDGKARGPFGKAGIDNFMVSKGRFTFPAPYETVAWRLTNADDCPSGGDDIYPLGYSYWRKIAMVSPDLLRIIIGIKGKGPCLISLDTVINKQTGPVPLFKSGERFSTHSAEDWYFSAQDANILYIPDGPKLLRYNLLSETFSTVFDIKDHGIGGSFIKQAHTSNDGNVHSFTLQDSSWRLLGAGAYNGETGEMHFTPKRMNGFDECQIDRGGEWLLIKDQLDGRNGEDNLIIDLSDGEQFTLLDEDGAGGHSDCGYGCMVASDNWDNKPNAVKLWDFTESLSPVRVYEGDNWGVFAPAHLSFNHARPGLLDKQWVLGSSVNSNKGVHANELIGIPLDGSMDCLVIAPTMTNMNAPGGGDSYSKFPKACTSTDGQYALWTANLAGDRLDYFLVKVPQHLLTGEVVEPIPEPEPEPTPEPPPADYELRFAAIEAKLSTLEQGLTDANSLISDNALAIKALDERDDVQGELILNEVQRSQAYRAAVIKALE